MDLFIVNRHLDVEVQEQNDNAEEEAKIKATLDRIVKNRGLQAEKERLKKKAQRANLKRSKQELAAERKCIKVQKKDGEYFDDEITKLAQELTGNDELHAPKDSLTRESHVNGEIGGKKAKKDKGNPSTDSPFTILGLDKFRKQAKVQRVLPGWLSKPTIISTDLQHLHVKVSSMKQLSKHLRVKLKAEGHKYFFPVQAAVIPYLLTLQEMRSCKYPNDVCVSAPTGSGKTLAFVLPIIQALETTFTRQIRAMAVLPTQDLAAQVFNTFQKFAEGTKLQIGRISGSNSFVQEQQQLLAKNVAFGYISKVDILVATAGRLVEHLQMTPGFTLEYLQFLVIDEADRVLENVQNDWLYHLENHIFKNVPKDSNDMNVKNYKDRKAPQKLLFSATLSQDPEKIHKLGLFQPKLFASFVEGGSMNKFMTPQELSEKFIVCSMELKPLVLYQFIKNENLTKTLVFVHSIENAHRLKVLLQNLFTSHRCVEEIGSKIDAVMRKTLISRFSNGEIDVLICTDALARGIDVPGVKCVIFYTAAKHQKTYIHRAGRTARAGEQGMAVTMLHEQQLQKFKNAMGNKELQEIKIDEEALLELREQYKDVLEILKKSVHTEEVERKKKIIAAKNLAKTKKMLKKAKQVLVT